MSISSSVSFPPISAASAVIPEPVAAAAASGSKKRPRQEEEVFQPLFDVEFLSAMIGGELEDCLRPDRERHVADMVASAHPDILMQLSNYLPSTVRSVFESHLAENALSPEAQESILNTIKYLSITSLLNSKYQMTISDLEMEILRYLQLSTKEHSGELLELAEQLLQRALPETLEESVDFSTDLNRLMGQISAVLNLFYYADPASKERIELLASEVKHWDKSECYPRCKNHFLELCQNLDLLANERAILNSLHSQIRAKMEGLKPQIKAFYELMEDNASVHSPLSFAPDREVFFIRESTFLWQSGAGLLKQVFLNTLQCRRARSRRFFFSEFVHAINGSAALDPRWRHCQFKNLFPSNRPIPPFPDFEVGFIGNVWAMYTNSIPHLEDFGDFMRAFICSIPEESFQTLVASDARETVLDNSFFSFFGQDATFETLRQWCEKRLSLTR